MGTDNGIPSGRGGDDSNAVRAAKLCQLAPRQSEDLKRTDEIQLLHSGKDKDADSLHSDLLRNRFTEEMGVGIEDCIECLIVIRRSPLRLMFA